MKSQILALAAVLLLTGCAAQKPVHVANVPYYARFDAKRCRYLPDGIRFKCKDVVLDPKEIDARQSLKP